MARRIRHHVALQSSIKLKQTKCNFGEIEDIIWKINLILTLFVKYFQITCIQICISPNTNDITSILHTCRILSRFCLRFTAGYFMIPLSFWVMRVKKTTKKTIASSWFYGKFNYSEKSKILPLL